VIVLVLGGTRSGKSEVAEAVAGDLAGPGEEPVTVVVPGAGTDADMAVRIEVHRARRPTSWRTVECGPALLAALDEAEGTVLIDSLGTWVAASDDLAVDGAGLVRALQGRSAPTVVVSEEVGLSVHPTTPAGRRFVDSLGELNRDVARVADEVRLVVAGRSLRLDS
jgi:adenosylcobinamide kinase/adenosylcobinamide-phosphate guanylyltransferase